MSKMIKIDTHKVIIFVVLVVFASMLVFVPGLFNQNPDPDISKYEDVKNADDLKDLIYTPDRSVTEIYITSLDEQKNELKKTALNVEVVNTTPSRQLGLSGRESVKDGNGMLFVFPEPSNYSFWMRDMLFSIDIIWIDTAGDIIYIEKNVNPDTYPKSFSVPSSASKPPSQYVLEVSAGFTDFFDIKIGDRISVK
jgi:uncharacterized membrane protein (UPF0127 family)